jgi:invasion protein IalB
VDRRVGQSPALLLAATRLSGVMAPLWPRRRPWRSALACVALALHAACAVASAAVETDLPAFGASPSVQAERRAWVDSCLAPARPGATTACALQPLVDATAAHYKTLDRVFVLGATLSRPHSGSDNAARSLPLTRRFPAQRGEVLG